MTTVRIKPAKSGLLVRNHQRKMKPLRESGESVVWDLTWSRRERDGDIVRVTERQKQVTTVDVSPAPEVAPEPKNETPKSAAKASAVLKG